MSTYFRLSKEKTIWIYGYTEIGRQVYSFLNKEGFNIIGFLDKNAIEINQTNVYSPDRCYSNKDVVIITLQSIISHFSVADFLHHAGCENIIFYAAGPKYEACGASKIRRASQELFNNCVNTECELPIYSKLYEKHLSSDIIRTINNNHIIWCPARLLFSPIGSKIYDSTMEKWNNEMDKTWEFDAPVVAMLNDYYDVPSVVKYLASHLGDCDYYIKRVSEIAGRNRIEYEKQVFDILEYEFSRGDDYFIDSPIICEWNDRGYFNIIDGCHRAVFLINKGVRNIPIAVSDNDYKKYSLANSKEIRCNTFDYNNDEENIINYVLQYLYDNNLYATEVYDKAGILSWLPEYLKKWQRDDCGLERAVIFTDEMTKLHSLIDNSKDIIVIHKLLEKEFLSSKYEDALDKCNEITLKTQNIFYKYTDGTEKYDVILCHYSRSNMEEQNDFAR